MADNEKLPRPLFGQIAIMAEFCTQQQVDECLKIQNKGRRAGTHFYLGTILINKGFLSLEHALKILKYQKVQIVQDSSNNNRYNIHSYSKKKKYRSPESSELLTIPKVISSITVRGDMGLKKITHESSSMPVVPGSLFDIENLTYEMELGGTSVDITSLNLSAYPFGQARDAISFDDIQAQSDEPVMIDPFQGDDFDQDPFGQNISEFSQDADFALAEPIPAASDPFTSPDDPFASAVDMFGDISETDDEHTEVQTKFPAQLNSSLYVAGSEGVQARQDDDEWADWGDSGESINKTVPEDSKRIDRTLDGPVMAELTIEEKASMPEDFDLVDGATMMDSDAGVEMGKHLRELIQNENIDLSASPDATTFEEAASIMDSNGRDQIPHIGDKVTKTFEEALAEFDTSASAFDTFDMSGFSDESTNQISDPFAESVNEQISDSFNEEITDDVFDEAMNDELADIGFDEGFEDVFGDSEPWDESEIPDDEAITEDADSTISDQWDVPDIKEQDDSLSHIYDDESASDIAGAVFWDSTKQDEFTEEEIAEDFIGMDEIEKITKHIQLEAIAENEKGINTLDLFTPDGDLQETVRKELLKDEYPTHLREGIGGDVEEPDKLLPILDELGEENIAEFVEITFEEESAVGELSGDVAFTDGALSGDIASSAGGLEGEILDVATKPGQAGDVIDIQIKRRRKKDFDYVDGLSLDEITTLAQEKGVHEVIEEQTDVDIKHVKEEHTDLDIKRSSGWRSLFYGRKSGDSKAKINVVFLISFLLGLTIIASALSLLGDFIQRDGEFINKYVGYFNDDVEIEKTTKDPIVWSELENARKLAVNLEFDKSITMLNMLENKYPAYKAIFQFERADIFTKQTQIEKTLIDEYNIAVSRSEDVISIREALTNVMGFIAKYSQSPYINIMKAEDYVKNAQDEIKIIEKELLNALIPKESKLINMLRGIAAWNPSDLLNNNVIYEREIQKHTDTVKEIKKALLYWKEKSPEVYTQVNIRSVVIFDFFDKELRLCDLLIKEAENKDIEINSIWIAIDEVKEIEKSVRKFEEFASVLKTEWILLKKQEINDEYVDKVYDNLVKLFEQVKSMSDTPTMSEYITKTELYNNLIIKIEDAKILNLSEKTRKAIDDMQADVEIRQKELLKYGNYAKWRKMALQLMVEKKYDAALEYFEKIYPFEEDENPKEINVEYNKCQFLITKIKAPEVFQKALEYTANFSEYSYEQLMNVWKESMTLYSKLFELLYDEFGMLVEYVYDDNSMSGFEYVNDCIENNLISRTLYFLWLAQFEYETGHKDRNVKIFTSAGENYKKALPYFISHAEDYTQQVEDIQNLIVKCEFEPLKLESVLLREQAAELLELNVRDKAEEALRLVEKSDELWNDALVIEQNNDLNDFYDRDLKELSIIAKFILKITREIRGHLYHEALLKAQEFEKNGEFDKALETLDEAKIYTSDFRWINKYNVKLKVKILMQDAKAMISEDYANYKPALLKLDAAAKLEPMNYEIIILKNKYTYYAEMKKIRKNNASKMAMIKGGNAILSSEDEVKIADFYIDTHEVTNEEYAKFIEFIESIENDDSMFRHPKQPTDIQGLTGIGIRSHIPKCWGFPGYNDPKQPVVGVTFWDAYAFAKWAGKRLPTATEWEYTASGKERRIYPWGNDVEIARLFCKELSKQMNRSYPMLVDSLTEGAVPGTQIFHLAGNVREWTAPSDEESTESAVKGGSFRTLMSIITNGYYEMLELSRWDDETGFRCAMDKDAK